MSIIDSTKLHLRHRPLRSINRLQFFKHNLHFLAVECAHSNEVKALGILHLRRGRIIKKARHGRDLGYDGKTATLSDMKWFQLSRNPCKSWERSEHL